MAHYEEHHDEDHEGHHILSNQTSLNVFIFLLLFTVITVIVAKFFHFGSLNFIIAMAIATAKGMAVMLFFMGLKYDTNVNRAVFFSGFAFLFIFFALVAADFFSRPSDMRVQGPVIKLVEAGGGPSFERPWEPSPEILAHGKKLFSDNACHSCHGEDGVNLLPQARSFVTPTGWKNGRRVSDIVITLNEGIPPLMNAFPLLSTMDKLALAHYVRQFHPVDLPEDTAESLKRVGVDITQPDGGIGGGGEAPKETIPVDFAKELYLGDGQ